MDETTNIMTQDRVMRRADELCEGSSCVEGVDRVALTQEHVKTREQLVAWAEEAGLQASIDKVGNLWFTPKHGPGARLLMGSHSDSAPRGGRYDGTLGILVALEVASRRCTGPDAPNDIAVVDFIAEESTRFGVGTIGSSVLVQHRTLDAALGLTDALGTTFGNLRNRLWDKLPLINDAALIGLRSFLEVHVDQATDLLEAQSPLGLVVAIAAPTRWHIRVVGAQAHAGSTPMHERKDALLAAADLIQRVYQQAVRAAAGHEVHATVGKINVYPNAVNVIAGEANLEIDLRVLDVADGEAFGLELAQGIREVEERYKVTVEAAELVKDYPALLDNYIIKELESTADDLGIPLVRLNSWGVHDAVHMASVTPTGMLMVRNMAGISHNPLEAVDANDVGLVLQLAHAAAERIIRSNSPSRGRISLSTAGSTVDENRKGEEDK